MRKLFLISCMLIFPVEGYGQTDIDDYSIPIVKSLLAERRQHFSTGFADKTLPRLGDRSAIALVKILSEQEMKDPNTIRQIILPLLLDAFMAPELITRVADRRPKVTVLLLKGIRCGLKDRDLKKQITRTIASLERLTAGYE